LLFTKEPETCELGVKLVLSFNKLLPVRCETGGVRCETGGVRCETGGVMCETGGVTRFQNVPHLLKSLKYFLEHNPIFFGKGFFCFDADNMKAIF